MTVRSVHWNRNRLELEWHRSAHGEADPEQHEPNDHALRPATLHDTLELLLPPYDFRVARHIYILVAIIWRVYYFRLLLYLTRYQQDMYQQEQHHEHRRKTD